MAETAELINWIVWVLVAVISLLPTIIFFIAYRRVRSRKLLMTTIAFSIFFIKALTLSFRLFIPISGDEIWYLEEELWWSIAAFLDIGIIGLITFALRVKE